jgi:pimeloyl-ACP methyl ester carboxylesterase
MAADEEEKTTGKDVMLIHGLWMTPLCWEKFASRLEEIGYNVTAPGWPGHEGAIEVVRKAAPTALAGLGLAEIVDHYENILREREQQPILIGHSFGGLVAEILLDHGFGLAGVGIDAAPPKGVHRLPVTEVRSSFPVLDRVSHRHKAVGLTFPQFKYAFANTMPVEEARNVYERYAVPDTGRPLFQAAFADFESHAPTAVDYANGTRRPLLLIAGSEDHTVPESVVKSTFKKYRHSNAVTEFKEFSGRSHLIILEEGWQEVVDFIDEWLTRTLAEEKEKQLAGRSTTKPGE